MLKRSLRMFALGGTLLAVVGCGGGDTLYPVSGKVTLPDGTPITKGRVNFDSDKHSAFGAIQSDGTYELTSVEEGDGVPAGTYKVYIVGAVEGGGDPHAAGATGKKVEKPKPLVAKEFESPDTTPLTKEVNGDTDEINIEVQPPK